VLARDFCVVVTATFRVIYLFVVLEVGTRRIVHWNVTAHPTGDWTGHQFRMIVSDDEGYRFVIRDRDTIYSDGVDRTLEAMGLEVLKTPARVPQANAFCERVIGTIRRECLDYVIPRRSGTFGPFSRNGLFITSAGARTAVWDQDFRIRRLIGGWRRAVTSCRTAIASS